MTRVLNSTTIAGIFRAQLERTSVSKPHVLIVGAGIGGLVAALALIQRGFNVSLYEQAAQLRELGAGLQITPNGSRVLCELGLQPAMEAISSVPTSRDL